MSISKESELIGMKKVSEAVACTLKEMKNYVTPGKKKNRLSNQAENDGLIANFFQDGSYLINQ